MNGNFSFTIEQEAAIRHSGGPVLVSAAAGSGKTKVLVERLLKHVGDGNDIDEYLVITYTRAAAAELRERIHDEISDRIANDSENRRMRRQSMLCRGAPIGTIHSFCTDILRDNANHVNLPPDFRVTDESESRLIKAAILDDVLNEAYETIETSDGFRALIDATSVGRNDRQLVEMILDAHGKLQSDPNPRAWAGKQIERLSNLDVSDLSETIWGKYLIDNIRGGALYWREEIGRLREEMRTYQDFDKAYGPSIDETIADCDAFINALDKGWEEAHHHGEIVFPRPKQISGYDDLKDVRKKCKNGLSKCTDIFACGTDEHIEDMKAIAPAITALLQLILHFDSAYSEEKRSRCVVDFSDLEHLALSLLIDSATGDRTEVARAVSRRFKEIMVDEYQDVNAVQELIFNAVSHEGKNIFMVGDVKQSIYRFRLADPSIFLGKYKSFTEAGSQRPKINEQGSKILLSKNFRSRAGILDFVNFVFERIMSEEFGEMDYTERERLIPGTQGASDPEPAVELDIIDMSALENDENGESPAKTQIEARFIAERVCELIDGAYMIPDGQGGERRIEYSDIAILLRSVSGKAWVYAGALSEYGIPSDMPGSEGYFDTIEISAALSLLSVIDNPMQDIPLAAALRGPVYGFSADELAAIRAESQGSNYYNALIKAAETSEKCAAFLREIDSMRARVPDMPSDRFIWHMYNKTGLLGRVGAMRGGVRRRSNLILLVEYARRIEHSGYKGLFGFLTYINGLQDKDAEISGREAVLSQNSVRIMSIHKSKGLEFPIVFLADTSKQFNYRDMQQPLVLHTALGVGLKRTDRQRRIEYPTVARMAIQNKLKAEMLAEEMRVLYVAMTRAREKLIITAALKENRKLEIGNRNIDSARRVSPQILGDIKSTAGWILAALAQHMRIDNGELGNENSEFGIRNSELIGTGWRIRFIPADVIQNQSGEPDDLMPEYALPIESDEIRNTEFRKQETLYPRRRARTINQAFEQNEVKLIPDSLVVQMREQLAFVYPHGVAPDLPSKLTVTELKGRQIDIDTAQEAARPGFAKPQKTRERRYASEKPGFIAEKTELSAAERGTALHQAMQYIDFSKCAGAEEVSNELRRLIDKGLLTVRQADAIDPKTIMRFLESDIGKRILKADDVKREFKFSLLSPAGDFFPGGGDDSILLQGIVDCFFNEDGELIVVDFKTDNVTMDSLEEKATGYTPQLAAYSAALERITGKHVKERIIYFFKLDIACVV